MLGRTLIVAGLTIAGIATPIALHAEYRKPVPAKVASAASVQSLASPTANSASASAATSRTKKKPVKKAPVTLGAGKASLQDFH